MMYQFHAHVRCPQCLSQVKSARLLQVNEFGCLLCVYVINNPLILPVGWELTQQPQLLDGKSSLTTEEFLSTMTGNQAEAFGSYRAQQSQHNPWTNDISAPCCLVGMIFSTAATVNASRKACVWWLLRLTLQVVVMLDQAKTVRASRFWVH